MNRRTVAKRLLDLLMTVLLFFLMGYQFWGDTAHEWAGAGMFLCFILHHILNKSWYGSLGRGKYTSMRIIMAVVNSLLFAAMLGLMISGIILSRHVFAFLPIKGGASFARLLHMVSAYWGFILMALHTGLHWMQIWSQIRKKITYMWIQRGLQIAGILIAVYGFWVFWKRNLLQYMLLQTQFVFLDFSEPKLLFYFDYLSMAGSFVLTACLLKMLCQKRRRNS